MPAVPLVLASGACPTVSLACQEKSDHVSGNMWQPSMINIRYVAEAEDVTSACEMAGDNGSFQA